LTLEDPNEAMKRKTSEVARSVWTAAETPPAGASSGLNLLRATKQAQRELTDR